MKNRYHLTTLFCMLCLTLSHNAVSQNEGKWYQVELLIFKNVHGASTTTEHWPEIINLQYPDNTVALHDTEGHLGIMPPDQYTMEAYRYTLDKQPAYTVLYHNLWQQQMHSENASLAIAINGGDMVGYDQELSGYITLYIGRYLHIKTNLWLHQPTTLSNRETNSEANTAMYNEETITAVDATTSEGTTLTSMQPFNTVVLKAHRKMRSKELHYIDHPLAGLLIYITPIDKDKENTTGGTKENLKESTKADDE